MFFKSSNSCCSTLNTVAQPLAANIEMNIYMEQVKMIRIILNIVVIVVAVDINKAIKIRSK